MSKAKNLFAENASDSDSEIGLNTDYATNYESWRRKEELNKCKARYGDIASDESTSSSDDDDGEDVGVLDTDFLQTLSCLKNEDPRIYDQNVKFFAPSTSGSTVPKTPKAKKEKPLSLRQYETNLLLQTGGHIEESEDEPERVHSPTYVEEQRQLKESFKDFLKDDNDVIESAKEEKWGGLFEKRSKSKEQQDKEDKDYVLWLKGQKESLPDDKIETELQPLKEYWNNPKLESGEKFLRDYFLNKRFLDDKDEDYIPSYEEIVHDSDEGLSEDEKAIRTQEEFETKYNYRFEEPDQEFIKRYPRTMENSLRKKDDRRKQKRAEVRERKEDEKLKKKEELQQLKAFKRKEIQEKIEKLKEITGNTDVGFNDDDLDGDFDPDAHDRRMQELFNDEFYGGKEGDQKPLFPDLDEELEIENWDKWDSSKAKEATIDEPHCEDENFNMDCDYDPTEAHQSEMLEISKGRKKRKRRSKFAEALIKEKPVFDPINKTYEEYLDEYYKLDYEDLIGDIPCRFKYRKVMPNSFGLTVEEILSAKDKELNKWCSLKKVIQIRPEHVEKYDQLAYQRKATNDELKRKTFLSLYTDEDAETKNTEHKPSTETSETLSSKKAKKKQHKNTDEGESNLTPTPTNLSADSSSDNKPAKNNKKPEQKANKNKRKGTQSEPIKAKKFKPNHKNKHNNSVKETSAGISDERLKAYGIKPKKFKNKLKYGDK